MGTSPANENDSSARSGERSSARAAARDAAREALREKLSDDEVAACLSHYDLGTIRGVQDFPRGSRRAPKALIETERGKFLLKRRSRSRDDLAKVGLIHELQEYLAARTFPLPHLVPTRDDRETLLVQNGSIYELFEFIEGGAYEGSLEATHYAGHILGLFHKLVVQYPVPVRLPIGSYHDTKTIHQAIRNTVTSLPAEDRPPGEVVSEVVEDLATHYEQCAILANKLGLNGWEVQLVHGDWHPGNMLFRKDHVVAVIDYDTVRIQQRVIDLANGALQFSMVGGGNDPENWPDTIDMTRFRRFLRGYDTANVITVAEINAIPSLMCEAMIAEAVLPIAATGSFGRIEGFPFLQMIRRKVHWVLENYDMLTAVLQD